MMSILKERIPGVVFSLALVAIFAATANAAVIGTPQIFNGHTYLLLSESSWPAAQSEAESLGGDLVTVNDAAENAFIYSTFKDLPLSLTPTGKVNLWLGYNDVATEGTFVWASGQSSSYTDWFNGQPQDTFGDEDYVGIRLRGSDPNVPVGKWIDIVSDNRLGDVNYGLVEIEGTGPSAPEPNAFLLAVLGGTVAVGGRFLRRRDRNG